MKVEANIDELSIEGLVKDVIIKRLVNEMYNHSFQGFVKTKSPEFCTKVNIEIKTRLNKMVSDKLDNWMNGDGESLDTYINRKLSETVETMDFEKIIKEKYIK